MMSLDELKDIIDLMPSHITFGGYNEQGRFFFNNWGVSGEYRKYKGKKNKNKWLIQIEINELRYNIYAEINGKIMETIWMNEDNKRLNESIDKMIMQMKNWLIPEATE